MSKGSGAPLLLATSTMVGHHGPFEIYKICIQPPPPPAAAADPKKYGSTTSSIQQQQQQPQRKKYARQPKLGIEIKSTEWMSRDIYIHFKQGGGADGDGPPREAASIISVQEGSLAAQAGVQVGDTLCSCRNPPTGVFHELLLQHQQHKPPSSPSPSPNNNNNDNNPVQKQQQQQHDWQVLSSAQFQDVLTDHKKDKTAPLIFYVARRPKSDDKKDPPTTSSTANNNRHTYYDSAATTTAAAAAAVATDNDNGSYHYHTNNNTTTSAARQDDGTLVATNATTKASSCTGVTLSQDIVARASNFSSLSLTQKKIVISRCPKGCPISF